MARWIQVLGEYDYQLEHGPAGKGHGNADGLSRKPCTLIDGEQPSRIQGTKLTIRRKNLSVHWKAYYNLVET